MVPPSQKGLTGPYTEGSRTFDPDTFLSAWEAGTLTAPHDDDNDFRSFIIKSFGLPANDGYVYRAVAEVTLQQTQVHIQAGARNGLQAWYRQEDGTEKPAPPPDDIKAYNSIFSPTTTTSKSLTSFLSNAKRDSLRREIASHLIARYFPPASTSPHLSIPKLKCENAHVNPYYDVWRWTNLILNWAGPDTDTANTRISHAVLPVLYHHFGCVVPSWDALCVIAHFANLTRSKMVVDLGSGNGYWTYMLRRFVSSSGRGKGKDAFKVTAVDNGLSAWRTMWIGDTIRTDGIGYLKQLADVDTNIHGDRNGGSDACLLLVYPQVGADFTSKVIHAYAGNTIIVAGTQNANGYTGFANETIESWMTREMPRFEKQCQIPLPSFAGKDEALFVYLRAVDETVDRTGDGMGDNTDLGAEVKAG